VLLLPVELGIVQCTNSTKWCLCHCLASVTTPSYSLFLMYSNVRKKCRFGFSRAAGLPSWLVERFEWMSSISPFKYFVVTCAKVDQHLRKRTIYLGRAHSLVLLVKIVDIAVQYLHKQLHGYRCVHASIRDSERSLQTLQYTFTVTVELVILLSACALDFERSTHILCIFFTFGRNFDPPPQMAGQVHCSTLIWLLEQLATV
jgi:hypothetical protein